MTASAFLVLVQMNRPDKQQAVEMHLRSNIYESWCFSSGVFILRTHQSLVDLMDNVREMLAGVGAALEPNDLFYAGPLARPYIAHLPAAATRWLEENLPHTPGAVERY